MLIICMAYPFLSICFNVCIYLKYITFIWHRVGYLFESILTILIFIWNVCPLTFILIIGRVECESIMGELPHNGEGWRNTKDSACMHHPGNQDNVCMTQQKTGM